jgi:CBS-domain-containing membrane protein
VVDAAGALVGIVTESDLLKMLVRKLHETEEQKAAAA